MEHDPSSRHLGGAYRISKNHCGTLAGETKHKQFCDSKYNEIVEFLLKNMEIRREASNFWL